MKTEHTPGPWKITYSPDGKEALINRGHVASVELDDNEQGEVNAKLIAAAPEIIEALLACETTLKAFLPDAFATISIVEQAIKKAKGKSQ